LEQEATGGQIDALTQRGNMRNKRLDVLRCIAVLLVMFNHGGVWPGAAHHGWIGVDLFFVLSGFLISGLLFNEYKTCSSISFKRFFIRRGLKIYPAFYLFLFLTGAAYYIVFHSLSSRTHYLAEVFFVQNYWQGVWDHTWSLGVEEHFYILLPTVLLFLVRRSPEQQDPFRALPWIFFAVAIMCIAFRAASVCLGTPNYHTAYAASHDRIDALFFGVLLGYFYHFRPEVLDHLLYPTWNRIVIATCSAGLLSTVFFSPRDSRLFSTLGFTCVYLGFGGVLLLSIYLQGIFRGKIAHFVRTIGTGAAWVGMYSYSIYLWHGPTDALFPGFVRRLLHISSFNVYERFAVYATGSLVIGIMMSKIIEYPILRLRDKIFPAPQGAVVVPLDNPQPETPVTATIAGAVPRI
jgi:peptidoglycan/LPS O-acetylase OafA/YrhL